MSQKIEPKLIIDYYSLLSAVGSGSVSEPNFVADSVAVAIESCSEFDMFRCEMCLGLFLGEHYSSEDCNDTGTGVSLCGSCVR